MLHLNAEVHAWRKDPPAALGLCPARPTVVAFVPESTPDVHPTHLSRRAAQRPDIKGKS